MSIGFQKISSIVRLLMCGVLLSGILMISAKAQTQYIYDIYSTSQDGIEQGGGTGVVKDSAPTIGGDWVAVTTTAGSDQQTRTAYFANRDVSWTSAGLGGGSAGSGTFTKMFGLSDNDGVLTGFNERASATDNSAPNSSNANYDQDSGVGLPMTIVKDVSIVHPTPAGGSEAYMELLYDGNQTGGQTGISLDEFMVFTAPGFISMSAAEEAALGADPSQGAVMSFFEGKGATLLWSLDELDANGNVLIDNTILLEALQGSGKADAGFYIPVSDVLAGNSYYGEIYLWIKHGELGSYDHDQNGSASKWGDKAGGEEWAYYKSGTSIGALVPEPGTYAAGFALVFVSALVVYLRRRKA